MQSILFPILKSFWKVRARLPFCNEAFPTVYEKVTRKVSAWFGPEKGLTIVVTKSSSPSSWSGESRREKRRESGASCRWEEKPCCLSYLQVAFLCVGPCVMNKVCMKKCHLWTQEFHGWSPIDHCTKFVTNDHNNLCATCFYDVFHTLWNMSDRLPRKNEAKGIILCGCFIWNIS